MEDFKTCLLHVIVFSGKAMMLECDVILQHVNGDTQKLLPVLADPPKTDSDITLDEWLDRVLRYNTGIKLDFHSIDAVEISLQKLKYRKADVSGLTYV